MSEEDGQGSMGGGHSAATDPRGTLASGELPDSWHSTGVPPGRTVAEMTPEERDYNRWVYGLTYSERYGRKTATCVTYCLTPGQRRRGIRCPACYEDVEIRPMSDDIEPGLTRGQRFAGWLGGWFGAFWDAMMFPFRVGRAHTEAVMRDILRGITFESDAMSDILQVLEGIEGELRAIRNTAESAAGES